MDQDLASELFGTETMAELCARQGRIGDAVAIYRKLLAAGGLDQRRDRWSERLQVLLHAPADQPRPGPPGTSRGTPPAKTEAVSGAAVAPPLEEHRMPMVIQQPVRSGQIIYAERNDLIVLAPVNPGAQLIADGNIHVYAPLRGRAVAGAHGAVQARIFCQRLEAELVGVDSAYVVSEDIPPDRLGKPAQISLADGLCVIAPL